MQDLLSNGRRNNDRREITGMTVFNSRHFLQVLEGDRQRPSDLYGRLVQDKRHQRLLRGCEAVADRRFADRHMGFAAADASHAALRRRFGSVGQFDPQASIAPAARGLLRGFSRLGGRGGVATGAVTTA